MEKKGNHIIVWILKGNPFYKWWIVFGWTKKYIWNKQWMNINIVGFFFHQFHSPDNFALPLFSFFIKKCHKITPFTQITNETWVYRSILYLFSIWLLYCIGLATKIEKLIWFSIHTLSKSQSPQHSVVLFVRYIE